MEEPVAKRVKIQIGSRSSGAEAHTQPLLSSSSGSAAALGGFVSSGSYSDRPLGELVKSNYLAKKSRGRRPSKEKGKEGEAAPKTASEKKTKAPVAPRGDTKTSANESGPRVEIIDGKIVIKASSLMVDDAQATIQDGEYEEVEEGANPTSRYSSFSNRKASRAWGIEETRIFYNALRQCGIDFSMLQSFFPSRTRRELKLKFRREESQHPELIKQALCSTVPLEMTPFELQLGVKLDIVPPVKPDTEAESTPKEEEKEEEKVGDVEDDKSVKSEL